MLEYLKEVMDFIVFDILIRLWNKVWYFFFFFLIYSCFLYVLLLLILFLSSGIKRKKTPNQKMTWKASDNYFCGFVQYNRFLIISFKRKKGCII